MWLSLLLVAGSLQERIDAAPPGATVEIPAGIHREHLTIMKPLTIEGHGRAVIDGGGQGTIVSITGAAVTLRGLTLRGSGESFTMEDSGVKMENADGCIVEHCRLEDVLFGLYVAKSSRCSFRDLWIGGKPLEMPRRGDGVRLWYSDDTTLERIEMIDSRDFVIWFARRTLVRACRIERCRYGLHYMYCDDNRFEGNVFTGNQVGGAIMYSRRITLAGNRFEHSRGPSAYGLLLKDADDVVAERNEFVDNTRGLYFDNSPQSEEAFCTIRRNLFALNDAGVCLLPDTRRARFEANTFRDNLAHVETAGLIDPAKNSWDGNYWSGHAACDLDGDGFSDIPYRPESAYEDLIGRHPELALLRFSPSVQAIETAARLFPLFRSDRLLEDAHPAMRPTLDPAPRAQGPRSLWAGLLAVIPLAGLAWTRRAMG